MESINNFLTHPLRHMMIGISTQGINYVSYAFKKSTHLSTKVTSNQH